MHDAPSSTHAYDASVERCLLYLGNYQSLGLINSSTPHFFIMENLDHNIHIGRLIDEVLKSKGMTHAQFARLLYCDRSTVYHLVRSKSIDTDRLLRISRILGHDFLQYYYDGGCNSKHINIELPTDKLSEINNCKITSITIQVTIDNDKE